MTGDGFVVSGAPTPAELAALMAVLRRPVPSPRPTQPVSASRWNERAALLRRPLDRPARRG